MSKEWFEKIKRLEINNNTYQIFKALFSESSLEFYFLWGKVDFYFKGTVDGSNIKRTQLSIKRNGLWYDFLKISGHGIFFEETNWKNENGEVFIETPSKFPKIVEQLALMIWEEQNAKREELQSEATVESAG